MPKTKSAETWRDWTPEERTRQPRRTCSIAGCKEPPTRVKETTKPRPDAEPLVRKHAYCSVHATD